jgi:DNA-binding MarR family transcriptional regulator
MSEGDAEQPWYETVVIPALLRHARTAYGEAMRVALAEIGCDDVPRNGLYVIGGLAMGAGGAPPGRLAEELGISREGAAQLIDALVARGYLERTAHAAIALTSRGQAAAAAQEAGRQRVDAALAERVGAEDVRAMRRALGALCSLGRREPVEEHEP